MKRFKLFFLCVSWLLFIAPQILLADIEGDIYVYAGSQYTYETNQSNSYYWKVLYGTISGGSTWNGVESGKQYEYSTLYGSSAVSISWKEPNTVEETKGLVTIVSDLNSTVKLQSKQVTIKSLTNVAPKLTASKTTIDAGKSEVVSITASNYNYLGNIKDKSDPVGLIWNVPNGWTVISGRTKKIDNTTFWGDSIIQVQSDKTTNGKITCYSSSTKYEKYKSKVSSIEIKRNVSFTSYPQFIPFGSSLKYNFSVTPLSGASYEWSAPAGWKFDNGSNTYTTTSNTVGVIPKLYTTESTIKVRVKINNDYSDWYTCEYAGIKEAVIEGQSTVSEFSSTQFQLNYLPETLPSMKWSIDSNMGIFVGSNTSKTVVCMFEKTGTAKLNVEISYGNGAYVKKISKNVTVQEMPISIVPPAVLCPHGSSFKLNQYPSSASITWSVSSGATSSNAASIKSSGQLTYSVNAKDLIKIRATLSYSGKTRFVETDVRLRPHSFAGKMFRGSNTTGVTLTTAGNFVSRGESVVVKFDTPNANNYKWSPETVSGISWGTDGNNLMFTINNATEAIFDCTANWGCCQPVKQTFYFSVRGYSVYVNSESKSLVLTKANNTYDKKRSAADKYVIYSMMNSVTQLSGVLVDVENKIDVTSLPSGAYIIHIYNGDFSETHKIIIN